MRKITLFILILLISLTIYPCDQTTMFFSSGGRGGGELNEARLLREHRNICPSNMYYGKEDGVFSNEEEESNSSSREAFESGLRDFISTERSEEENTEPPPPLLKLHIAGHGTSFGDLDQVNLSEEGVRSAEEDILRSRRSLSDFVTNLAVEDDSENFLQITNETCLSGNALAQMIGIPLNHPFNEFDYAMYSTDTPDGEQDFPKARNLNKVIRESDRTTCGVASSTGHTNVIFPHRGDLNHWRRRNGNTMVDTHGRFKVANGGRNPSPAETEYCALRNPEHPSAPISSSTLFLEQLSHQLGRDHTQQQSIMGSDYLISRDNPNFSKSLHCVVDNNLSFQGIQDIQVRLKIMQKRAALKSNIAHLLGSSRKLRRLRTDEQIRNAIKEASEKEMRVSLKFLEATKELEQRLEREKEKERRELMNRKRDLTMKSKDDFLENRRNERLFNSTVEFNEIFQGYREDIDALAKSSECKLDPAAPDYTSTYIGIGDSGGDSEIRDWAAPADENKFTRDCISRMKQLEEAFKNSTQGMRIIAEILPAGPNESVEEKLTSVLGNSLNIFFTTPQGGDPDNQLYPIGGALSDHRQITKAHRRVLKSRGKINQELENLDEKYLDKTFKARTRLSKKMKSELKILKQVQALHSNIRALMALDQLAAAPYQNSILLSKLSKLQECETLGGNTDITSTDCGFRRRRRRR